MEEANIWTAVSDGDFQRTKYLIEIEGMSPNAKDENSYTPIHAAVSWGHKDLLRYLIERGGDINITDDDGETAIFTAEEQDILDLALQLGADPRHINNEGLTPAVSLLAEYPDLSSHLASITGETLPSPSSDPNNEGPDINGTQVGGDREAEELAQTLISHFNQTMVQDGLSTEERERMIMDMVRDAVERQVQVGREMDVDDVTVGGKREGDDGDEPAEKRRRADDI